MSLDIDLKRIEVSMDINFKKELIKEDTVFSTNITHNLNRMAQEAGIYGIVWRPEENGIKLAEQLIKPLTEAVSLLESNPDHFKKFDAENGWGTYKDFLPWLKEYLNACIKNPVAEVYACR